MFNLMFSKNNNNILNYNYKFDFVNKFYLYVSKELVHKVYKVKSLVSYMRNCWWF